MQCAKVESKAEIGMCLKPLAYWIASHLDAISMISTPDRVGGTKLVVSTRCHLSFRRFLPCQTLASLHPIQRVVGLVAYSRWMAFIQPRLAMASWLRSLSKSCNGRVSSFIPA